jgi:hypothetical protein
LWLGRLKASESVLSHSNFVASLLVDANAARSASA